MSRLADTCAEMAEAIVARARELEGIADGEDSWSIEDRIQRLMEAYAAEEVQKARIKLRDAPYWKRA